MPTTGKQIAHSPFQSSADVDCTGISKDNIGRVWLKAAPMLKPALGEGETLDMVFDELMRGKAQLWIAATATELRGVLVTEIYRKGERLFCNIWLCGGRGINDWFHFLPTIEAWAKEKGCDAVKIERARIGWQRLMKAYKVKSLALEKEL